MRKYTQRAQWHIVARFGESLPEHAPSMCPSGQGAPLTGFRLVPIRGSPLNCVQLGNTLIELFY